MNISPEINNIYFCFNKAKLSPYYVHHLTINIMVCVAKLGVFNLCEFSDTYPDNLLVFIFYLNLQLFYPTSAILIEHC